MILRLSLLAVILGLIVAIGHPAAAPGSSPVARPTPVGLQYDEITKMPMPPATAPPVGSFQADYAAMLHPAAASDASADDANDPELQAAMKAAGVKMPAMMMSGGQLQRFAFYKGWIRVDDVLKHTAEIRKCDRHQFIELNLEKKTYHINNQSAMEQEVASAGAAAGMHDAGGSGSITMVMSRKGTALGSATIDGVATKGYSLTNTMTISQVTGNCGQRGSFSSISQEYVSGIHQPHTFCPMRPSGAPGMMGTGCKPSVTMHDSGGPTPASDRLVMYSKMGMMAPGSHDAEPVSWFVTERGNVKVLYLSDAEALFAIPADFTKE